MYLIGTCIWYSRYGRYGGKPFPAVGIAFNPMLITPAYRTVSLKVPIFPYAGFLFFYFIFLFPIVFRLQPRDCPQLCLTPGHRTCGTSSLGGYLSKVSS